MGNDGGSIPTRRELVKEAARRPTTSELRATRAESLAHRWQHCFLTDSPLKPPIVSDALGHLFNKDSVLEFLLAGSSTDENEMRKRKEGEEKTGGVLSSLKDIVELKFSSESNTKDLICPITQKRLDEHTRAVYIVPCGHVFSEAAVTQTMAGAAAAAEKGEELADKPLCLQCSQPYASNDVVPILPIDELEVARLTLRIERLQEIGLSHSLKKAGGRKRKKANASDAQVPATSKSTAESEKKQRNIGNSDTASITARVMQEQAGKKRKQNDNLESLYSKKSHDGKPGKNNDFMTRGYAPISHNGR